MGETEWSLRPASDQDVPAVHALSLEVGWPHRLKDYRFLLGLGRASVALDGAGRIGGCAAWWPFGPDVATIGIVIVSPALQGRGLGRRLMDRAIAEAGPRRIRLIATEAGRPLYERMGFVPAGALRQHQGIAKRPPGGRIDPLRVRSAGPADRAAIAALDSVASCAHRQPLLDALAAGGQGLVHESGGRITGYAYTRPFGRGALLGPLVAEDDRAALALADAAVEAAEGAFLRMDLPFADGPLREWILACGLAEVADALPMVRGIPASPSGPARIYALAAQALG